MTEERTEQDALDLARKTIKHYEAYPSVRDKETSYILASALISLAAEREELRAEQATIASLTAEVQNEHEQRLGDVESWKHWRNKYEEDTYALRTERDAARSTIASLREGLDVLSAATDDFMTAYEAQDEWIEDFLHGALASALDKARRILDEKEKDR